MRRFAVLAAAAATLLSTALPAAAVPARAPHLPQTSFQQLAQPLPLPYNESASAQAAVASARARARANHKLLLIDLGGNWCLDCRILAGTMELPQLRGWVRQHYEVVTVDIGRFDKNLDVPAAYGIRDRLAGVPSLLIVDPASNRLLNAGRTAALADARSMNPQALADWLAQWTR